MRFLKVIREKLSLYPMSTIDMFKGLRQIWHTVGLLSGKSYEEVSLSLQGRNEVMLILSKPLKMIKGEMMTSENQ